MSAADQIREALRRLNDPCSVASGTPIDIESMGLVKDVQAHSDGTVRVEIRLTSPSCVMLGYFTREIERLAATVQGVRSVDVRFDAGLDWEPTMMSEETRRDRAQRFARRLPLMTHDRSGHAARAPEGGIA